MPDNVTPIVRGFAGPLPAAMPLAANEINISALIKRGGESGALS